MANRIRVIVSGLHFSDEVQHKLTVFWRKDDSLSIKFSELFEFDDKIVVKRFNWVARLLNKSQNSKNIGSLIRRLFSVQFCFFDKDVNEYVWSTGSANINLAMLPRNVSNYYFSTCHEFYFDAKYLRHLRPIAVIQDMITYNKSLFTKKTIGVHIRRTDHAESIKESPLESFIDTIRYEIDLDNDVNFYLSTDDKDVEDELMRLFPDKILSFQRNTSRKCVKGVQDALVDLYSLSGTKKIYGSYYSSFSEIASRIGDIPLEVVRKTVPGSPF